MSDEAIRSTVRETQGYVAYIVRNPTGTEFLLTGSIARNSAEARKFLRFINRCRAEAHKPFFQPVRLVDVVVTITETVEHASKLAGAAQA